MELNNSQPISLSLCALLSPLPSPDAQIVTPRNIFHFTLSESNWAAILSQTLAHILSGHGSSFQSGSEEHSSPLTACFFRPSRDQLESIQVPWEADAEARLGVQEVHWVSVPTKEEGEGSRKGYRSNPPARKGRRKQNWGRTTSSHGADPSKLPSTTQWKAPEQRVSDRGV